MSGGFFNYKQWHIDNIACEIEQEVIKSGKPIPKSKWDYYERQEYEETHKQPMNYAFPDEVLRRMEEAVYALRRASIYAQRADYLISGDDNEESFMERLKKELAELDSKSKMGKNGVMYYVVDREKDPYENDD